MSASLKYFTAPLPQTKLYCVTVGKGDPLIIVPATISEIDNWIGLVHFMAQRFKVYFFELPGHGKSSPFVDGYSSDKVVESVGHLADYLEYERFSLMGFSFGGILSLKTLNAHNKRIDAVVMLAPCVSHEAIEYSPMRLSAVRAFAVLMRSKRLQDKLIRLINNPKTVDAFMWLLAHLGHVEVMEGLQEKLLRLPDHTLDVLVSQVNEILTVDFSDLPTFSQPCFFSMSVNDPLLSFDYTFDYMKSHFPQLMVKRLSFPYHQPPKPFTLKELNAEYGSVLTNGICIPKKK